MSRFKKENTLIIVGNGFDLAHNYKTRYSDFIEHLFTSRENDSYVYSRNDELLEFKINLDSHNPHKSIAEQLLDSHRHEITIKNKFLEKLLQNTNYKWVDFESFYFKELLKTVEASQNITELNAEFRILKTSIIEYLERELIVTFREPSKVPISDSINDFFQKLGGSYESERMESERYPIHILNFNYSNTPIRYSNSEVFFLNNIHGTLVEKSEIIFGYGDETVPSYQKIEDLNIDEYHFFFKSIAYLMDDRYNKLLDFIDREEGFDVEILGHSCGISDRVLLKTIFEHPQCKKIRIHYHQWENSSGVLENDFENKMINISRHFSDKTVLRSKVLDFKKSNPLIPFSLQNKFR